MLYIRYGPMDMDMVIIRINKSNNKYRCFCQRIKQWSYQIMANIHCQGHVQLHILLNLLILGINKFYTQTILCNYSNCFVNKCINRTYKGISSQQLYLSQRSTALMFPGYKAGVTLFSTPHTDKEDLWLSSQKTEFFEVH